MGFGGLVLGCVFFVPQINKERGKIMKKLIITVLSVVFVLGLSVDQASAATQKKKLNMDAANIAKAAKVIHDNRELFQNKELMQTYMKLVKNLKKK